MRQAQTAIPGYRQIRPANGAFGCFTSGGCPDLKGQVGSRGRTSSLAVEQSTLSNSEDRSTADDSSARE